MSGDPGLFHTIYSTRALRRFKPDPISNEVLFQLLDAAIRAPSGQNAQDWRFVLVRSRAALKRMQQWSQGPWQRYQARFEDDPVSIDKLPRSQRLSLKSVEHLVAHLAEVPVVIIVCGLRGRHGTPGGSTFPAVQNLLLAARGLGLAGSVFNFPLRGGDEFSEMFNIPKNNEIYCLLPLGYPTDKHGPVRRKPVKAVVYDERFGNKWRYAEGQPEDGWEARWLEHL